MSRSRMKHIIPYIAILLLATVIIYSNAEKERTRITERCQDTFSDAIRTEKKTAYQTVLHAIQTGKFPKQPVGGR